MINSKQEQIIRQVTNKYRPKFLGVFGSFARGEENENSDLDLLIDFDYTLDLLELISLEQELSELLGVKVDLVTVRSLSEQLKPHIEKHLVRLI